MATEIDNLACESSVVEEVRNWLFENRDEKYKAFNAKLIPTRNPDTIIGVRVPILRKYAKVLAKTEAGLAFIKNYPHKFFEETFLHGLIIIESKDLDFVIKALDDFLPMVDNWAICDSVSPKLFKKYPEQVLPHVKRYLKSTHPFTVRFGINVLMDFYLDNQFSREYLDLVANVKSQEYYVKMEIAWYFATALAKQYDATLPIILQKRLEPWVHNKTIQKAIESYRISQEQKTYLRSLKVDT